MNFTAMFHARKDMATTLGDGRDIVGELAGSGADFPIALGVGGFE
jgi:hypothetical protein